MSKSKSERKRREGRGEGGREWDGDRQRASHDSAGQGTCHVLKSHRVS